MILSTNIEELQTLESDDTINHHQITTIKKLLGVQIFKKVYVKKIDTSNYIIPKNPSVIGFVSQKIELSDDYQDDTLGI